MTKKITIIDYGIGNSRSVISAFEHFSVKIEFTDSPQKISNADALVLIGVGAFNEGMEELNKRNLVEPIKVFARTTRPFMGICLGMQMMLDRSYEFKTTSGLGLIAGEVIKIPEQKKNGQPHKIPHIGWAAIQKPHNRSWESTILRNIPENTVFYFVHSYTARPTLIQNELAHCDYDGQTISAAIVKDHMYGFQFHPEKSGPAGLQIIKNFCSL